MLQLQNQRTLELSDKVVGASTGGALVWGSRRSSNWLGDPSCPPERTAVLLAGAGRVKRYSNSETLHVSI